MSKLASQGNGMGDGHHERMTIPGWRVRTSHGKTRLNGKDQWSFLKSHSSEAVGWTLGSTENSHPSPYDVTRSYREALKDKETNKTPGTESEVNLLEEMRGDWKAGEIFGTDQSFHGFGTMDDLDNLIADLGSLGRPPAVELLSSDSTPLTRAQRRAKQALVSQSASAKASNDSLTAALTPGPVSNLMREVSLKSFATFDAHELPTIYTNVETQEDGVCSFDY